MNCSPAHLSSPRSSLELPAARAIRARIVASACFVPRPFISFAETDNMHVSDNFQQLCWTPAGTSRPCTNSVPIEPCRSFMIRHSQKVFSTTTFLVPRTPPLPNPSSSLHPYSPSNFKFHCCSAIIPEVFLFLGTAMSQRSSSGTH